mmetsp:Transcript_42325/g.75836  ORF Transcript_42325/g.75836 Transcript_42325/m.75836 type:complete len:90 (+) Transcript_42325:622-891(+)
MEPPEDQGVVTLTHPGGASRQDICIYHYCQEGQRCTPPQHRYKATVPSITDFVLMLSHVDTRAHSLCVVNSSHLPITYKDQENLLQINS